MEALHSCFSTLPLPGPPAILPALAHLCSCKLESGIDCLLAPVEDSGRSLTWKLRGLWASLLPLPSSVQRTQGVARMCKGCSASRESGALHPGLGECSPGPLPPTRAQRHHCPLPEEQSLGRAMLGRLALFRRGLWALVSQWKACLLPL